MNLSMISGLKENTGLTQGKAMEKTDSIRPEESKLRGEKEDAVEFSQGLDAAVAAAQDALQKVNLPEAAQNPRDRGSGELSVEEKPTGSTQRMTSVPELSSTERSVDLKDEASKVGMDGFGSELSEKRTFFRPDSVLKPGEKPVGPADVTSPQNPALEKSISRKSVSLEASEWMPKAKDLPKPVFERNEGMSRLTGVEIGHRASDLSEPIQKLNGKVEQARTWSTQQSHPMTSPQHEGLKLNADLEPQRAPRLLSDGPLSGTSNAATASVGSKIGFGGDDFLSIMNDHRLSRPKGALSQTHTSTISSEKMERLELPKTLDKLSTPVQSLQSESLGASGAGILAAMPGFQPQVAPQRAPVELKGDVVQGSLAQNRLSSASVMNVSKEINQLKAGGGGEMKIRLHPEELGEIHVHVRTDGRQVGLRIQAGNAQAREILEQSLPHLKDTLAKQHLSVAKVEVLSGPIASMSHDLAAATASASQSTFSGAFQDSGSSSNQTQLDQGHHGRPDPSWMGEDTHGHGNGRRENYGRSEEEPARPGFIRPMAQPGTEASGMTAPGRLNVRA